MVSVGDARVHSRRYAGLDGLRGIAAGVVLTTHLILTIPALTGRSQTDPSPPWLDAVLHTPLHLLTAGGEAVIVFFVLSGFVLIIPFMPEKKRSWSGYYPKRIVRLYLPVIASVALAVLFALLVPRIAGVGTWWVGAHVRPISGSMILGDASLLLGTGKYNSVLWSLQWEVFFSLLLPVYVLLARWGRRHWILGAVIMAGLSIAGNQIGSDALRYLPIFGIGVFLGAGRAVLSRVLGKALWAKAGVGIVSIVAFTALWALPPMAASHALLLVGCATAVVAFYVATSLASFSETALITWLGSRSFSLYLVHEPIVVSAALIAPEFPWPATAAIGGIVALVITEIFYRLVEMPSMRLAGRAGRRAETLGSNDLIRRARP